MLRAKYDACKMRWILIRRSRVHHRWIYIQMKQKRLERDITSKRHVITLVFDRLSPIYAGQTENNYFAVLNNSLVHV